MFRLGLVGAGRMGRTHLRALVGSTDVRVTALAEPVVELRESAVADFGPAGFDSLEAMLAAGDLDGVLIVTPSDTHVAVIERVAAAGLPILCEKPCGLTAVDTRRAQAAVRDAGVALQIGYWRRFVPELRAVREKIVAGGFGDVLSLSCLQWDGEPPASAFRARSGGVFIDMGVHEFDQARWLVGGDLLAPHAAASPVITDGVPDPDSAQVLAASDAGATVFISLGRHYAGGDMATLEVFGTTDHQFVPFLNPEEGEAAQLAALAEQASAFARYARGGACEGATVDDGVAALALAEFADAQLKGR